MKSNKKILHITNGNSTTEYLKELDIEGDILTWQEMLCEGPTAELIDTDEFFSLRKSFLSDNYDIDIDKYEFDEEIEKLNHPENYTSIVLWFEYDLFCHINLIGVISLIKQKGIALPLHLVCSGRIEGEKDLKGIAELQPNQLLKHYKDKVLLKESDIELALSLWQTYCGKDHNLFKPYIVQNSSFKYMGNCLKAHLKRFPDSSSGLDTIEANILAILRDKEVRSKHHLLGYILNYQGYYGFGDLQLKRFIDQLSMFYQEEDNRIVLNRYGHEVLLSHFNASSKIKHKMVFGGVNRLDYQFSKTENKLIKTVVNAY